MIQEGDHIGARESSYELLRLSFHIYVSTFQTSITMHADNAAAF